MTSLIRTTGDLLTRCRLAARASEVDLRFEQPIDAALDRVWRVLTASPHREHWIPCAAPDDLRRVDTVQPPLNWPALLPQPNGGRPALTGITRVWQAPCVFEWTTELDIMRWELSPLGLRTHLALTVTIAASDPDVGAHHCVDADVAFHQFGRIISGANVVALSCRDYVTLARSYSARIVAARHASPPAPTAH